MVIFYLLVITIFHYLGIWAKPNGNYVCIEPWLGIADNENTNQELKNKRRHFKIRSRQNI